MGNVEIFDLEGGGLIKRVDLESSSNNDVLFHPVYVLEGRVENWLLSKLQEVHRLVSWKSQTMKTKYMKSQQCLQMLMK